MAAIGVVVLPSCSEEGAPPANNAAAPNNAQNTQAFAEQDVIDILNAVNAKNVEKVRTMLQANPKLVNAIWKGGGPGSDSPLLTTAAKNGNKEIVELLIANGADVNEKNGSGETALMYAASAGHKEIVELLLSKNADINAKTELGATAMRLANGSNHKDVADLLQQRGAK